MMEKETVELIDETNSNPIQVVENLISQLSVDQEENIDFNLKPMEHRDFISLLPKNGLDHIVDMILSYLDADSLKSAELVCKEWNCVIGETTVWKKLVERKVRSNTLWRRIAVRRGWIKYLFKPRRESTHRPYLFYRQLFQKLMNDVKIIDNNWRIGACMHHNIHSGFAYYMLIYSVRFDDLKIVAGFNDGTIKIFDRKMIQWVKTLTGHTDSVLCLQFNDKIIISGSKDATVRVWDVNTGEILNILTYHGLGVRHLRICNSVLITCSKDRAIAVWDMISPSEIIFRQVLVHHRDLIAIDFDEKYIVTGGRYGIIKVWSTLNCEFVRTLTGNNGDVYGLEYHDGLVVSASEDNSIRIWDIETGSTLRVLESKQDLTHSIRFDSKHIVTGAITGTIKVWDLEAALDPTAEISSLYLRTFFDRGNSVLNLQCNEFEILTTLYDNILVRDFSVSISREDDSNM